MGRGADKTLAAALLVVRGLTLLAGLAVLGGIVYWLLRPAPQISERHETWIEAPPARPEDPPPPVRLAEPMAPPPLPPLEAHGTTRLVRRLEVGGEIARLLLDVAKHGPESARFEERYERLQPFLLAADGVRKKRPDDAVDVLGSLTMPHRDLEHLKLADRMEKDPLGRLRRLRVWTTGEAYPDDELHFVSSTIDAIVGHAGRDVPGGIDVLVTPGMGLDVFPLQTAPPWATGVFYHADAYCVVRSTVSERYRPEVVKHECIHALCWSMPSFSSSRFVAEGLAEYLRMLEPGDRGLNVPVARFADHFAALNQLVSKLEDAGMSVRLIDPRLLVELSPRGFYALRHFSYLVAQLTLAYVGGDPIGRGFAEGSDAPIVAAIREIPWPQFLEFVREEGKKGHATRAVIVEDAVPDAGEALSRDREALGEALRGLGPGWPQDREFPDPAFLRHGDAGELGTEERVVAALEALREFPGMRCCFLVANVSATREVVAQTLPEAILKQLGRSPDGATPKNFATSLLNSLQTMAPRNVVARISADRSGAMIQTLQKLVDRDHPMNHVVVVDTGGAAIALQLKWPDDSPPPVVLVVDLSEDGEGVDVALRYDRKETLVAYWRLRFK